MKNERKSNATKKFSVYKMERHCPITEKEITGRLETAGQPRRKSCAARTEREKKREYKCERAKGKIIMSKRKEKEGNIYLS